MALVLAHPSEPKDFVSIGFFGSQVLEEILLTLKISELKARNEGRISTTNTTTVTTSPSSSMLALFSPFHRNSSSPYSHLQTMKNISSLNFLGNSGASSKFLWTFLEKNICYS